MYEVSTRYNASHAAMTGAGAAAERAFDSFEAAKSVCTESTERVEEIQTSQRTGEKVCRELVKEVQSDIVIQLTEVRDRLLAADDGGKCTKKDLYAATMAMHGEAAVGPARCCSPQGLGFRVERGTRPMRARGFVDPQSGLGLYRIQG